MTREGWLDKFLLFLSFSVQSIRHIIIFGLCLSTLFTTKVASNVWSDIGYINKGSEEDTNFNTKFRIGLSIKEDNSLWKRFLVRLFEPLADTSSLEASVPLPHSDSTLLIVDQRKFVICVLLLCNSCFRGESLGFNHTAGPWIESSNSGPAHPSDSVELEELSI